MEYLMLVVGGGGGGVVSYGRSLKSIVTSCKSHNIDSQLKPPEYTYGYMYNVDFL